MENEPQLIFDLSCLQGQIADVGIGLQGVETQRLLNNSLYTNVSVGDRTDTKSFIHDLTKFLETIGSDNTGMNKGLGTFYISSFLYNAMMTLNKFVNEVEYDNSFKIQNLSTGGVKPFSKTFSQDLYRLIKKGKLIQTNNKKQKRSNDNFPDISFTNDISGSIQIKTREDLLNQILFIDNTKNEPKLESNILDSYQVIIPETFLISDPDFGNNMRKLITDLYKEYYYYEIVDIQKRLNRKNDATNLDTNLRILLQETRNAFTREIYSPNTDISTEFPLSTIITELNDFINELDTDAVEKYNTSLYLFDDNTNSLSLYAFIEEKSHMLNYTGNAYHYALEICKRIQRISDYRNTGNNNSLGPNPHFNKISDFTEDTCIQGIDEGLAIISNLTNELNLLTGDNINMGINTTINNTNFEIYLNGIEDIYHNYLNYASEKNGIFNDDGTDLNDKQLDSLGIINVLEAANLFIYDDSFDNCIFNGGNTLDNYKTHIYYKNTIVSRYGNVNLYRNFSLIVIKIAISLTVLYIFRLIQFSNYLKTQNQTLELRTNKNDKIYKLLSRKLPNNLTITDYTTISRLKRKLEKMTTQLHRNNDTPKTLDFNLPTNDEKSEDRESLKICYENILGFMNNQVNADNSSAKITTDDSAFINSSFDRLYPFTKSMLYQYDEYFSVNESNDYNSNNSNSSKIEFGTILNGLNYVAQSVARNKSEKYTVADMEKLLTKIIYLCTCLTVNWSDHDKISTTSIEKIVDDESPMKDIIKNLEYAGDHGLFVNKEVNMDKTTDNGPATAFKTTILGFIYGEMKAIVNSDLTSVVKYVYWLSLYCINSYFIHLLKKDIKEVVTSANA